MGAEKQSRHAAYPPRRILEYDHAKEFDSDEIPRILNHNMALRFQFHHRLMQWASKLALGHVWVNRRGGKAMAATGTPVARAGPSLSGRASAEATADKTWTLYFRYVK